MLAGMYVLHASVDAIQPPCPHVICPDGFAWVREGRGPGTGAACVEPGKSPVLAGAELVSRAIDGEPLDRALACAEIARTFGEPTLRILFPPRCRVCGKDHWTTDGKRLWHSGQAVHPEAVSLLREAKLPLRAFRVPDVPEDRKRAGRGRSLSRGGSSYLGLPVRSTPEATLAAQVAYAIQQRAKNSPLVVPAQSRYR
jgi:hypothetical protein